MKEYTGILPLTIEVTIKPKTRKEATSLFYYIYLSMSVENDGNQQIEIIRDNLYLLENIWELED